MHQLACVNEVPLLHAGMGMGMGIGMGMQHVVYTSVNRLCTPGCEVSRLQFTAMLPRCLATI